MPDEWADRLDGWVFGCDVCQDVCPWNRKAPTGREAALLSGRVGASIDLLEWLESDDEALRGKMKGTALERARRGGMLRNALLLLGSARIKEAVAAIVERLRDADPTVRWAAAWALGRIGSEGAIEALRDAGCGPGDAARGAVARGLHET
jgi:epoxyqueuosine reductase